MSKQVMQLRSQQAMLRTAFEGELQRAAAECTNGVEALQSRWRQVHLLEFFSSPSFLLDPEWKALLHLLLLLCKCSLPTALCDLSLDVDND